MKKESPLWSSISLLIGIVIAILALIRGRMLLPLLLAVFALWLLWWLLTQALPLWRNNRAYCGNRLSSCCPTLFYRKESAQIPLLHDRVALHEQQPEYLPASGAAEAKP